MVSTWMAMKTSSDGQGSEIVGVEMQEPAASSQHTTSAAIRNWISTLSCQGEGVDGDSVAVEEVGAAGKIMNAEKEGAEGKIMNAEKEGAEAKIMNAEKEGAEAKIMNAGEEGAEAKIMNAGEVGAVGEEDEVVGEPSTPALRRSDLKRCSNACSSLETGEIYRRTSKRIWTMLQKWLSI